jgi:hypothetical protein
MLWFLLNIASNLACLSLPSHIVSNALLFEALSCRATVSFVTLRRPIFLCRHAETNFVALFRKDTDHRVLTDLSHPKKLSALHGKGVIDKIVYIFLPNTIEL